MRAEAAARPSVHLPHYTFGGWKKADGTLFDEGDPIIDQKRLLTADWNYDNKTALYELKFVDDGAPGEIVSQWFVMGETLTLKEYEYGAERGLGSEDTYSCFLGWNTKKDRSGRAYGNDDAFTYDGTVTTLYAQWSGEEVSTDPTASVYRVTYYSGDTVLYDEGYLNRYSSPYQLKTLDTLINIPQGKQLVGWTLDPNAPDARIFQPGEKITLQSEPEGVRIYAVWTSDEIVSTFEPEVPQLPETGDGAPLVLWMALLVISCIGAAALPLLLHRKEYGK